MSGADPAALIRIHTIWLTTEPVDKQASVDLLLARIDWVLGAVLSSMLK
ncbi:hypothetical protein [Mycetohabitans sp. B46]